jgi:hypothetical protein
VNKNRYFLECVQEQKQLRKPIVELQDVKLKVAAVRLPIHRAVRNAEEGLPGIFGIKPCRVLHQRDCTGGNQHGYATYGGIGLFNGNLH